LSEKLGIEVSGMGEYGGDGHGGFFTTKMKNPETNRQNHVTVDDGEFCSEISGNKRTQKRIFNHGRERYLHEKCMTEPIAGKKK
jgi:hypothetical protein